MGEDVLMTVEVLWVVEHPHPYIKHEEVWVPGYLFVDNGDILWTASPDAKAEYGEQVWDCLWERIPASNVRISGAE